MIDVISSVYHSALTQRRSFWKKFYPNDVLTRLTQDVYSVKSFVIDLSHSVIFQSVLLFGTLAILHYMSWHVGVLLMVYLPLVFAITYLGNNYLNARAATLRALGSSFMQTFQQGMQQPALTFSWGLLPFHLQNFRRLAEQMEQEQVQFAHQAQKINQALALANLLVGTIAVLCIIRFDHRSGTFTAGKVFALIMYAGRASQIAMGLGQTAVSAKIDRVATLRIHEMLAFESPEQATTDPLTDRTNHPFFNGTLKSGILLPRTDKFLFHLTAENGAGKTTFSQILSGFDDLSGKVVNEKWFLIPSDPMVFPGTLLDNIRIIAGREVSAQEVLQLLRAQRLEALMSAFPSGFSTLISEHSEAISRGQKQAAVLVSAVVKNPRLLVVDEGFNSLDLTLKAQIKAGLLAWLNARKSIMIEHGEYLFESRPPDDMRCERYIQEPGDARTYAA